MNAVERQNPTEKIKTYDGFTRFTKWSTIIVALGTFFVIAAFVA